MTTLNVLPALRSLEQLSLAWLNVQLGPASDGTTPGALAAATGTRLTQLSLYQCNVVDKQGGLRSVSAIRSLRNLSLVDLNGGQDLPLAFPGRLLSVLVQLTYLSLDGMRVLGSSMQHFSRLASLQVLHLGYCVVDLAAIVGLHCARQLTSCCCMLAVRGSAPAPYLAACAQML